MKQIKVSAPGRIDLAGGATDWCGMSTISLAINLRAYVKVEKISNPNLIQIKFEDFYEEYTAPNYGTPLDLFKKVIELSKIKGFRIEYSTKIPKGSGLGGSASLTVATIYALNELFKKNWNKYYIAELAQRAESLGLETVNGYQDQYTSMFGGLISMDFRGKECQIGRFSRPIEEEPYAMVEDLSEYTPNFYIVLAIPKIERISSDETNKKVSYGYMKGDKEIINKMKLKATTTKHAKKAIVNNNIEELYKIINLNNSIMRSFGFLSKNNEEIIKKAMENSAKAVKTCGAGKGAVALFCKNEKDAKNLVKKIGSITENALMVKIDKGARIEK